jgi:hypothetical protein
MASITVTFDVADDAPEHRRNIFPVTVENVGELLFEDAGGNLTAMSESDKQEMDQFVREEVTPDDAIQEALSVIATAPAFDDTPHSEVDAPGVEATVEIQTTR